MFSSNRKRSQYINHYKVCHSISGYFLWSKLRVTSVALLHNLKQKIIRYSAFVQAAFLCFMWLGNSHSGEAFYLDAMLGNKLDNSTRYNQSLPKLLKHWMPFSSQPLSCSIEYKLKAWLSSKVSLFKSPNQFQYNVLLLFVIKPFWMWNTGLAIILPWLSRTDDSS